MCEPTKAQRPAQWEKVQAYEGNLDLKGICTRHILEILTVNSSIEVQSMVVDHCHVSVNNAIHFL